MPADLNTTAGVRERLEQACTQAERVESISLTLTVADAKIILAALPPAGPAPVVGSVEDFTRESSFLIDRISELDWGDMQGFERDWHGHVAPSLARLAHLAARQSQPSGADSHGEEG